MGRKRRKPNYSLPDGDHVVVKPVKRSPTEETEARIMALLAHPWWSLDSAQQQQALGHAFVQGESWAEVRPGEPTGPSTYVSVAVRYAYETCRVVNDEEYAMWRVEARIAKADKSRADPRFAMFAKGARHYRAEQRRSRGR